MATFVWLVSKDTSKTITPRVLVAQFGDGYSQRGPDGLNSMLRIWSVSFQYRDASELDAIEAFLEAHGGYMAFDWLPPHGPAGKWICDAQTGWSRQQGGGQYGSLTATFKEVPA